ncbi:carbohydrate ABC transporter substrate-binding protein, CUT1 family [Friedmanniella luteola]|uniref:Carbohydrate ABC transporter substrate-binding protein, CUT1 family n=1 Tax=Friedmanniella luteola TaxID=546871 RepID=A0A1H1QJL6_9ACTN|nr:extracellular solute-binding protein [Friedmanniella luteola]SDS23099.1 carbohydrate ABC transporter substrate-binding protein, CUT1 family [Friedmanniella luteola]
MKNSHKTLLALGLATSLGLMSACGGGGEAGSEESADTGPAFTTNATGNLSAWGFENADEVGTSRLDYAKEKLTGVTIKIDATAFDAQKFTTRAASGEVPDVVQMDRGLVATYAAQDLILPLDSCFSAHTVDVKSQYYPSVVDDVSYDGHVWAVPQFYQPPAIILNKRVMDAAGVTEADIDTSKPDVLLPAVEKMYKANGNNPTTMGFDPVATGQSALWILGLGGQLIDAEGVPTLDNPGNTKALAFLKQLLDAQGGYAKVKSFTDSFDTFGAKNQYVKDQVGAQVNAQWYVNVLTPYVKDVDIAAVPFKGVDGQPFTVAGGSSFVIPKAAKNPDAACAWAINLTAQDAWMAAGAARAKTIAKTPGAINTGLFTGSPAADEAIRTKYVKTSDNPGFNQTISTYYDVVATGKSNGASPAGQQISTELQNAITSSLLGTKSPEEALKDAQTAAMRAYNQVAG